MAATRVSRRGFLVLTQAAGAGLLIGGYWPGATPDAAAQGGAFAPSPFLRVDTAGKVTVWAPRPDMGQGVFTSLPLLVAKELRVEWSSISIEQAGPDPRMGNQLVGGSGSIRESWELLRKAGATARMILIDTAAKRWGVDPSTCRAERGTVVHEASNRSLSYGAVAAEASAMPVPKTIRLTDPDKFRLIGKPTRRADTPAKVQGTATFGIDVRVPGMVFAMIARPPAAGGDVVAVDDTAARKVAGVTDVVRIPRTAMVDFIFMKATRPGTNYYVPPSVAVIANSTFAAKKGRDALKVQWKGPDGTPLSTELLRSQLKAKATGPAWKTLEASGDVPKALTGAAKTIRAEYEAPLLAHATMEPLNATASVTGNRCEVWAPTQHPQGARATIAKMLDVPEDHVTIHVTFLGGGFGRKVGVDFIAEAVLLSKAIGKPVQAVWSREDDIRHDMYRQASHHAITAGLDAAGALTAWHHHVAATPVWTSILGGPDEMVLEFAQPDFPAFSVPNYKADFTPHHTPIPIGFWRSVEHSYNAFVIQSFLDEVAAAAGKDPLAFRLELLGDRGVGGKGMAPGPDYQRLKGVLRLAAEKAGWGSPLPKGRARGIAMHFAFASYAANVAEVEVQADGSVKVTRIVAAVDCGTVVNPLTAVAQVEGCIVMGLAQTLKHGITLKDGAVVEGNFDTYPMVRINEMPQVEVHFVPSTAVPTGIGEPALPPVAPAVANAIFAATGKRLRRLPIRPADLKA